MRIVADNMLVKLARWLRLGGISVENAPYTVDNKIISFVKRKKALLLTSDKQLARRSRRRGFDVLLINDTSLDKQLAYVIRALNLKPKLPSMICPVCNGKLKKVSKSSVKDLVPKKVYALHKNFYKCSKCGKIYWRGTHWKRIKERYKRVEALERKISLS
ncbi:MAG: Mut7-C RNAse domain-containing protein [Candidatus Micrarchaeota archaeon]